MKMMKHHRVRNFKNIHLKFPRLKIAKAYSKKPLLFIFA